MSLSNLPEGIIMRIKQAIGLASESSLLLQKKRLAICRQPCDNLKIDLGIERCGLCSCILKLKTLVKTESCKAKKW